MNTPLPVVEAWHSWQGEGVHSGRNAFFIRTYSCPLKCGFCDSANTWHKDYVPEIIHRYTPEELAQMAADSKARICIVTGGEPTIHDLSGLVYQLRTKGIQSHLETSGAFPIKGDAQFSWITLSPKRAKMPLKDNLAKSKELKLIIEKPEDIWWWVEQLEGIHSFAFFGRPVWLHPEWSKRDNPHLLNAITEAVKNNRDKAEFRAGWQMHRLYRADLLDKRSAHAAPLGGNPENGY